MIKARIKDNSPTIKGYIYRRKPEVHAIVNNTGSIIKGVIHRDTPFMIGRIKKAIDHEAEPYYEVANEYGTTIIIGD